MNIQGFLPISRSDMEKQGLEELDFVFVTGDAYVDHHSFAMAVISRVLVDRGYTVGIIAQPDWKNDESIKILGKPRLAFLVSAGNMDSMVNHYTAAKKRRNEDAYSPGGAIGKRPDRATIVYGNMIRRSYPDIPIIIGGIEASLRRLAHYDYWSDKVRRSILIDSCADILSYGMGERSIVEIADALDKGIPVEQISFVRGTVYRSRKIPENNDYKSTCTENKMEQSMIILPDYDSLVSEEIPIIERKKKYADSFYIQYKNTDPFTAKILVEAYGKGEYIVQNPPSYPLSSSELDRIYELPYMGTYHPVYEKDGGIPAVYELKFSLTSCRGCFGACNFCALNFHQGRIVQARSHESLVREAVKMTKDKDFKGYINDVGGPTANFRHPSCKKQLKSGTCKARQCLFPSPCKKLDSDHSDYISLLKKLRQIPGVKKVFIRSGIRFDYILCEKDDRFLEELCKYHISGQLKVAPEHISDNVLKCMGKPQNSVYEKFREKYRKINERLGKKQYMVPYLMSSHPGSTLKEAVELAEYVRDLGYSPEQVQDFYPTPSTLSTCMYYTGINPETGEEVYVPKTQEEKAMQRTLIQYRNPVNKARVREALIRAGREDLIGYGKKCLITPLNTDNMEHVGSGRDKSKGAGKPKAREGKPKAKEEKAKAKAGKPETEGKAKRKKKTIRNIHKKKN